MAVHRPQLTSTHSVYADISLRARKKRGANAGYLTRESFLFDIPED